MNTQDEEQGLERFQQLHADVEGLMADRVASHQMVVAADDQPGKRLNLLATGDSWFDYPLGGDFPGVHTDVLAALQEVGSPSPRILSFAHYGDTTEQSLALSGRERLVKALQDGRNGKFDAILYSGGGDDIVGGAMPIWLNDASAVAGEPARALSAEGFAAALAVVRAGYESLARLRDRHAPGLPIFVHAYDFAIPSGVGVYCIGPWLKPSLDYCGWSDLKVGTAIVRQMLTEFGAMLEEFARATPHVVFVPTQGTLAADQWANELHATPAGFRLIAAKFRAALATRFPGRI